MTISDMRAKVAALVPYARRIRPSQPDSFPPFMDGELRRIDTNSRDIVQVIKDLDARIAALE